MDFKAYKHGGLKRYEKFAKTIKEILEEQLLNKKFGCNYLLIQERAKTIESLQQRLKDIGKLGSKNIENDMKDLAGCRIIFYTNNDVDRFMRSFFPNELFDIRSDLSKLHHPDPGEKSAVRLFRSCNYVISLKAKQIAKPEYQEFDGMLCEIQVQTILEHAWAHIAHDTIYKKPEWKGFGTQRQEEIEKLMADVKKNYLDPADYSFQKIENDMQRIAQGKELFDAKSLDEALESKDINKLSASLSDLKNKILPDYDDVSTILPEIREKLKEAWLIADKALVISDETETEILKKSRIAHIIKQVHSIIHTYRYIYPEETYTLIRDLYTQASHVESKKRLIDLAEKLASHNHKVWQRYGPAIQVILADLLRKEEDITLIVPVVIAITREILNPEIRLESSGADKITWGNCSISYSEKLEKTRKITIDILIDYATSVVNDDEAIMEALNSLFISGSTYQYPTDSEETAVMIFSNFTYALERVLTLAVKTDYKVQQRIEEKLFRWWRQNSTLPEHLASSANVVKKRDSIMEKIMSLQNTLNADEEFVIFKTITGHGSVFSYQWNEPEADIHGREKKKRQFCHQQQDKFIDLITPEDWPIWKKRLMTSYVESNDIIANEYYVRFLSAIVEQKPDFAYELLEDRETLSDTAFFYLAKVLINGELQDKVKSLLNRWFDEGLFIDRIANSVAFTKNIEPEFALKVARRGIEDKHEVTCICCVVAAMRNYSFEQEFWRDKIFFPCLEILKQFNPRDWIRVIANENGKNLFFSNLTADQSDIVLDAMVNVDHIDYEVEQILEPVAIRHHQTVLDWFGKRIEFSIDERHDLHREILISFEKLHKALQPYPQDIMLFVRQWANHKDWIARKQASELLKCIYPKFEDPLSEHLLHLISDANTAELKFIATTLQEFGVQVKMLPVLKAIIASGASDKSIEDSISCVLYNTRCSSSGPTPIYQERIEWLKEWGEDKNEKVSRFAKREIRNLENTKAESNRMFDTDRAMRRLDFGESPV